MSKEFETPAIQVKDVPFMKKRKRCGAGSGSGGEAGRIYALVGGNEQERAQRYP